MGHKLHFKPALIIQKIALNCQLTWPSSWRAAASFEILRVWAINLVIAGDPCQSRMFRGYPVDRNMFGKSLKILKRNDATIRLIHSCRSCFSHYRGWPLQNTLDSSNYIERVAGRLGQQTQLFGIYWLHYDNSTIQFSAHVSKHNSTLSLFCLVCSFLFSCFHPRPGICTAEEKFLPCSLRRQFLLLLLFVNLEIPVTYLIAIEIKTN